MWTCPVCTSHEKEGTLCLRCGYNESLDFIRFRTIFKVTEADNEQIQEMYGLGKERIDSETIRDINEKIEDIYKKIEEIYKKLGKDKEALPVIDFLPEYEKSTRLKNEKKVYKIGMLQPQSAAQDDITKGFMKSVLENLKAVPEADVKFVWDESASIENNLSKKYDSSDVLDTFTDMDMLFYNEKASRYLLSFVKSKYKKIPIIAAGITNPASLLGVDVFTGTKDEYSNVTGTVTLVKPEILAGLVREIFTDRPLIKIGLLYFEKGTYDSAAYQMEQFAKDSDMLGMQCKYYPLNQSVSVIKAQIEKAARESDILYLPYCGAWNTRSEYELNKLIEVRDCGKPVIAATEGMCRQYGTVTCVAADVFCGEAAGEMAVDIFKGKAVSEVPVRFAGNSDSSCVKKYNEEMYKKYDVLKNLNVFGWQPL